MGIRQDCLKGLKGRALVDGFNVFVVTSGLVEQPSERDIYHVLIQPGLGKYLVAPIQGLHCIIRPAGSFRAKYSPFVVLHLC